MRYWHFFLAGIGLFYITSCESVSAENSVASDIPLADTTAQKLRKAPVQWYSTVNGLSLREVPDQKGKRITTIPFGSSVTDLEETSDFKEKIELRGEIHYTTWQKVAYHEPNGNLVEGWAYGGGLSLEKPSGKDGYMEKNSFTQTLKQASPKQVQQLLDLDVPDERPYDGTINYVYPSPNEPPLIDGPFRVTADWELQISKNYTSPMSIIITGSYNQGRKDGIFRLDFQGYESSSTFTSSYQNGVCQWFEVSGQAEGQAMRLREDNPASCTFNYMGEWMKRNYN